MLPSLFRVQMPRSRMYTRKSDGQQLNGNYYFHCISNTNQIFNSIFIATPNPKDRIDWGCVCLDDIVIGRHVPTA